ncbi:enoyl-CoA hydratase [Halobacteriales archaeon QS_3_64_16]|nr:MAG: enoyl-CoA hydratase [Halobacteriales archaeon QS_3_64_16]
MTDDPVLLDIDEGVATITLNRPEIRNALAREVSAGIVDAIEEIEGSDARCVVLEGSDEAFCAGGNINSMTERLEGDLSLADAERLMVQTTGRAISRVAGCQLPTVAKVDGPAFGAGANLAIACDIPIASDASRIGFGFRQVGLAVDSGTSYLLPRLVGLNTAKELVFTGELLDADRAADLGLFNRVFPAEEFDERAEELTEEIATGPTVALRASKRMLDQGLGGSLDGAIADEAAAQTAVFETRDHREGVAAFEEKRNPEFEGH